MRMVAGAILLLAASILFGKYVDYRARSWPGSETIMLLLPTVILAFAGFLLLVVGTAERSEQEPKN